MSTKIILKKSSVVGKEPLATDLDVGELAVNLADGKLYSKNTSNAVITVGGQDFVGGTGISITGDTITNTSPHVSTNLAYTASTRLLTSSTGTNVTLPQVTTSADGLMIAADKTKLNGIATGATANTGTVTSVTGGDGLSGTVTTTGSLAVDGTVVRTSGNQTIGGIKTYSDRADFRGGSSTVFGNELAPVRIAYPANWATESGDDHTAIRIQTNGANETNLPYGVVGIKFATSTAAGWGPFIGATRTGGGNGDFVIKTGGQAVTERLRIADNGNITFTNTLTGNGSGLTTLNASNLSSGTVAEARLPAAALIGDTTYSAGNGIGLSGTTFSVAGGDGLTQQTTGLAVDNTVVRTTGNQTVTGPLTLQFNGTTAPLRLPNMGTSNPTTLASGDLWVRSNVLYARLGSSTRTIAHTSTWSPMSVAEGTTGTATSSRFMRADHLKQIIEHYVAQGAGAGAINGSFYESDSVINQNYTVATGKNSMVAGPITVNDGVTITIPDGSSLIVV